MSTITFCYTCFYEIRGFHGGEYSNSGFWVVTPFSVVTSLHLEDGSSMILRNVDILAHHYTALHPKRLRT
jgi:hypothetical protein